MPVSLEEIMKGFSPEERERIERNAETLAADHRLRATFTELEPEQQAPDQAAIGTRARTGERCPESGIWRVEDAVAATAPIAIHDRMPPYRKQAVTWILMRHA